MFVMNQDLLLGFTIFLACMVEMVEALTIVLAIGVAREWRSTWYGGVSALALLAVLVAVFGPALSQVPTRWLWVIMGGLLTIFGLQWMRKAVLRYAGIVSIHDETAIYKKVEAEAKQADKRLRAEIDWYAFTVVFKGVLIEGFEVVFIVLAVGAAQGNLRVGIISAAAAFVVVAILGLLIHRPLAQVPENTMKFVVGIILTTFGTFFAAKGIGISWPSGDGAILGLLVFYLIAAGILVTMVTKLGNGVREGN
jgi:uncharacterized membrane protein